jgi:hypothetical protein
MLRAAVFLIVTIAFTGCVTQAERAARMQQEVDDMISVYGPACEKLGYNNATDQWRDCVIRLNTSYTLARYRTSPTTTTCFGHRGFFNCSTF